MKTAVIIFLLSFVAFATSEPKPLSPEKRDTIYQLQLAAREAELEYQALELKLYEAEKKVLNARGQIEKAETEARKESGAPDGCGLDKSLNWNCARAIASQPQSTPQSPAK